MRTNYVLGLGSTGFHRLHYTEWGDPANSRVLLCAHGLTRNGRDFDVLAAGVEDVYRVVCPDLPGRGHSDWLSDPTDYDYRVYAADVAILLARLNVPQVDWLGTSMGGLLGMLVAAMPNTPIRRFVLNDIGPALPQEAKARIGGYVGGDERFADLRAAEDYVRATYAPFGDLTDAQWRHLTRHSVRQLPEGGYALHYDPAIGNAFQRIAREDLNLWAVWEAIRCPVLVLHGEHSDVLPPDLAQEMARRNPRTELAHIRGAGHAPPLMSEDQIKLVRDWLLEA